MGQGQNKTSGAHRHKPIDVPVKFRDSNTSRFRDIRDTDRQTDRMTE